MKSKQLILVAIALICGIVSAVGIFQAIASKGPVAEAIPTGQVIVASAHIELKGELTEENVSLEEWPQHLIPEGAASSLEDVTGKFSKTQLRSGQAVIQEDAVTKAEMGDKTIPPGHKVINIKVPAEDLLAGLLEPGDHVDIIGVFDVGDRSSKRSETKTFLKRIQIFNVGTSTSVGETRKQSSTGIVGVIVTEKQSEKIVWARKNGEIRLALVGDLTDSDPGEEAALPMYEEEPVAKTEITSGLDSMLSFKKPKMPSVSHSMKVFNGSQMAISHFDASGKPISMGGGGGSSMSNGGGSSTRSGGSDTRTAEPASIQGEGMPSVDYEGYEETADSPDGNEEDQYRGE